MKSAGESGSLAPPKHSLNAPTRLMKDLGYSKGYVYDPDTESGFSGQNYFPEAMERRKFYRPKGDGTEAEIKKRLEAWDKQRQEKAKQNNQKLATRLRAYSSSSSSCCLGLASGFLSTSSMTARGALSPWRNPAFKTRV